MGIIVEQQIIEAGAMLTQLLCVQFPPFKDYNTHLVIISNMCFFSSRGFSAGVSFRTSAMLGLGVEEMLPCRLVGLRVPTRWATLDFLLPALCPSCRRARSVCPWVSVWLLIQEMNISLNQSRENWYMTSIWARSARTKYRVAPLVATFKW